MSIKRTATSNQDQEFEKPAQGTFPAVCVAVVVTGTHNEAFPGQEAKDTEKIYLAWELLGETMAGGKFNFVIGREFTLSLNAKSNLCKLINGWRSNPIGEDEEFDLALLLKQPCLVNVTWTQPNADGKQYANVAGVSRPMKGQQFAKPMRPFVLGELVDKATLDLVAKADWLPRIYGKTVAERMLASNEGNHFKKTLNGDADRDSPGGSGSGAPMTQEEHAAVF